MAANLDVLSRRDFVRGTLAGMPCSPVEPPSALSFATTLLKTTTTTPVSSTPIRMSGRMMSQRILSLEGIALTILSPETSFPNGCSTWLQSTAYGGLC